MSYYIGVTGPSKNYLPNDGDMRELTQKIKQALNKASEWGDDDLDPKTYIVSSLIFEGVTMLAHNIAQSMQLGYIGIDCTLSKSFDAYPHAKGIVERYVKGPFGAENEEFIKNIDVLIPIGNLTSNDRAKIDLARTKGIPVI